MDGEVGRGYSNLFMLALTSVPELDVLCNLVAELDGVTLMLTG